jgi:hypothetical protein
MSPEHNVTLYTIVSYNACSILILADFLYIVTYNTHNAKHYQQSNYTVTRIDGKLHLPLWMALDQTIRVMDNNFNICDGHIRFFPSFLMEIFTISKFFYSIFFSKDGNFRRFEIFRLCSFSRMEILDICDEYIRFFPTFPMKIFSQLKVFQLYSALIYISTSLSCYAVTQKRLV